MNLVNLEEVIIEQNTDRSINRKSKLRGWGWGDPMMPLRERWEIMNEVQIKTMTPGLQRSQGREWLTESQVEVIDDGDILQVTRQLWDHGCPTYTIVKAMILIHLSSNSKSWLTIDSRPLTTSSWLSRWWSNGGLNLNLQYVVMHYFSSTWCRFSDRAFKAIRCRFVDSTHWLH